MIDSIAIIGANLAGGRAAEALRTAGFEGKVHLIGEEPWRPYERPPLSKDLLWKPGELPATFFLHNDEWYDNNRIDLRLGQRAESLDLNGGSVRLASGETLSVDRILLATGGQPRRLPLAGANAPNVHYLRTRDDADRLAADLRPGAHIVVVGMGVIGSEVAASARKAGCEVTAIEPGPEPMVRMLGQRFGHWLGNQHRKHGVNLRLNTGVSGFELGDNGNVRCVICTDVSRIACDAVVVGIGIVPAVELAETAGLTLGNGVVVDRQGRTSHENVFAAGDVADQPCFFGGRVRLETYQNSAEQAAVAAKAMLGQSADHFKPAWFWSDQYDINIQVTGRISDQLTTVLRGDPDSGEFSAFFLDGDVVAGILTINKANEMGVGKRLVERRASVGANLLSDTSLPMRELLKAGSPAG